MLRTVVAGKPVNREPTFDPERPDEIAQAVAKLSPEEAAFFLAKLESVLAKRKIQLTGYLIALGLGLLGMLGALVYYGTHDGFVGWVFLLPLALVGGCMYGFGKWADKVGRSVVPSSTPPVDPPRAAE